ncbi:hypothetical protein DRQ29_05780 [bacterium]|nr:MAG: hypothetical protein DRQ29_05780 [bacterium]
MRFAAKIENVKKLKFQNAYSLWVKITDVLADTVKISSSLKGKIVKITREFPKNAPQPSKGELIVLDEAETKNAIAKIKKPKKIPKISHNKSVKYLADLNGDGYDEMFLGNSFAKMVISPIRAGRIVYLSTNDGESFFDNTYLKCIWHTFACGASFTKGKSKNFDIESAKFEPEKMESNKIFSDDEKCSVSIKSKISNVHTTIKTELSANSPVFKISLNLDNSAKKTKAITIEPYFKLNIKPFGYKSSDLYFQEPSGEIFHCSQKSVYAFWDFNDEWINYIGDIKTDKYGFFAIGRESTGDGLCISFDTKTIPRVWSNKYAPLPHIKMLLAKKRIPKNSGANFEIFLTPMTKFKIANGFLLGYTKSDSGCFIIAAGRKKPRVSIIVNGIIKKLELQQISNTMFGKFIDNLPDTIELKNGNIKLVPKR